MRIMNFKVYFLAVSLPLFLAGASTASTDYSNNSARNGSVLQSTPVLNSENQESSRDLFPEPVELRPNVFFWVNIYTKYMQNQAIVHDASDLNIHFEVVDLNVAVGPKASRRSWNRYMEKRKRVYREILRNLSRQNGECKTEEECRVAGLFGYQPNGKRFRVAADDVRIQFGMADRFRQGLIESGRYIYKMREIFKSHDLPEELLALPHVESSFNVKAYSKFGAAGVWQFTRSTGRLYMDIDYSVDERRDPFIATDGAARLLKRNYKDLGNWPLAITAYNHGRYGMLKAKKKYGDDIVTIIKNNDLRLFGFASRNFYAEFLAAKKISQNPERYFGPVGFSLPLVYDEVSFDHYAPINILYKHFGYSKEEIMTLNPALRMPIWDGTRRLPKNYKIKVPYGTADRFEELYASAPADMLFDKQLIPKYYKVMRGDALSTIADRFRMSTASLMEYNNLRSRHRIYAGQNLKIPPENYKIAKAVYVEEIPDVNSGSSKYSDRAKKIEPIVKRVATYNNSKDTLINYAFADTIDSEYDRDLVLLTKMKIFDIEPRPEAPSITEYSFINVKENYGVIRVLPEETIGHYSFWTGVSVSKIQRLNGWSRRRNIILGQKIKIPLTVVTSERFEENRYEYHLGLYEDFFEAYKVEKVEALVIGKGQSLWSLCNETYDTPMWLVKLYNKERKFDNIHPGERIMMPIIERLDNNG